MNFLNEWLFFSLSNKAKFAIKVALSITLTYLFILAMGLEYASIAVITIMLIASPAGVKNAVSKGLLRIGGTIVGAVLGMILISLFPQHPFLYLLSLSFVVTLFLYLRNAYTGDNTLFMLGAMTSMAVFDNGNVDNVFMYGVDRTFITILAIVIYTLIFILIWPNSSEKSEKEEKTAFPSFIWLDIEHIKGAVQAFVVFWIAAALWYFLNPPGGFMLVMLATGFSALTSFSPVKPSVMAIFINISLFIAIILYIFILPNLTHWLELSLLLFAYTFFAFYFFPPMLSIIILIGLNTLMITNTMSYHVDLFLEIVLLMDMVFALLIFIYYFPFSSKPEHLYPLMVKRFMLLSSYQYTASTFCRWYASVHLNHTFSKLKLWGSKIDFTYFNSIHSDTLYHFALTLDALIMELKTVTKNEEAYIQTLFQQWFNFLDKKTASLPAVILESNPILCEHLIECQKQLESIQWNQFKAGRF